MCTLPCISLSPPRAPYSHVHAHTRWIPLVQTLTQTRQDATALESLDSQAAGRLKGWPRRSWPNKLRNAAAVSPAAQWQLAGLAVRQHATPPATLGRCISARQVNGANVVRKRSYTGEGQVGRGVCVVKEKKHGVVGPTGSTKRGVSQGGRHTYAVGACAA